MNAASSTSAADVSGPGRGAPGAAAESARVIILEAGRTDTNYWRDLWTYRELFAILAWRDVSVRYKQTAIGFAWAIIRPLITMVVFTVVFGQLAKLPSVAGVPYPLLVFAGTLPWFLCASILGDASNSLVGNSHLIGKVYFPRLIIPASAAIVALVDFAVSMVILAALYLWFGYAPGWQIILLPLFIVLGVAASAGPALLLAALNVKYRDFRFLVPFIVQIGLYISPVGFSSSVVPEAWRLWYSLNPMVGVIDGFRWCLLGGDSAIYWPGLVLSVAISATLLAIGVAYFRKTERAFADVM